METSPSAINASGEGGNFGRLVRPPVTAKGHQENLARKRGSSNTSFPDWPKPRKRISIVRLHMKNPTIAWNLSHSHSKEVSIT